MTLENLLMKEKDGVLLDIYTELKSCKIPATGYAHAYCHKVNHMIDKGELCVLPDKYRKVYLPTLSKMIFKEMSRRYFEYCFNQKVDEELIDVHTNECSWCGEEFDTSELYKTDIGVMCDHCIAAIRSRGEKIVVYS